MVALNQSHDRVTYLLLLTILVITVLIYMPGLNGGFLYDDYLNIVNNPMVHPDSLTPLSLLQASGSFTPGGRYMSMMSFALNSSFLGPSPYWFKAVNLAIHLINGVLVFFLTRLLIVANAKQVSSQPLTAWLPIMVSAAWLLNPMELSTVLYSVQRMTGLSALFVLAGLLMFTSGRLRQLQGKRGMPLILAGLLGCTFLAWLNKENGILLLPFALLIEMTFFRFNSAGTDTNWKIFALLTFVSVLILGLLFNASDYSYERIIAGYSYRDFTLQERLMTEARILWLYLRLILLPDNGTLGLWHDDIEVSSSLFSPTSTFIAIVGIIALLVAGLYLYRRLPLIGFGILWFFVAHSLESTIIPLELAHEHRNYLASYGVLLAAFTSASLVSHKMSKPWIGNIIPITFIAAITLITFERSKIWSNPLQHALIEVKNHPYSAKAQYEAGKRLISLNTKTTEALKEGMLYLETAAALDRTDIIADVSLITTAELRGIPPQKHWFENAKNKTQHFPVNGSDVSALRLLLECQQSKRCSLPHDDVIELFNLAAEKGNLQAITLLAFYEANVMGNIDPARRAFKRAVKRSPKEPSFRVNYASFLAAVGEFEDAKTQLDIAQKLDKFQIYKSRIDEIDAVLQ